jgi:hypothetical protein
MDQVVYHRVLRQQGVVPPRAANCQCAGCVPTSAEVIAPRVAAFGEQLAAWRTTDRIGIPVFVMPDSRRPVGDGYCLSCGEPLPKSRRFRCAPCIDAIHVVVEGSA